MNAESSTITVAVRDKTGQSVGTIQFDSSEIGPRISKQLLHDVVVMYETNRRVGTVMNRNRAQTEGSTKKLFRQKGTGRARMGTLRTGVRRGGGRAHAKYPVDYSYRLPKKAIRLATRMALLSKFLDDQVTLVNDLAITEAKTKNMCGVLKALGLSKTSCLLAIEKHDPNVWRSGRNLPQLCISSCDDLNANDLLHKRQLILTRGALDRLRAGRKEKETKEEATANS
jgi:large subunit ribosomal protein L4